MRISPTHIRYAITNPSYRIPTTKARTGPTTDGALRKAIRIYHTDGLEAAMTHIEQGLSHDYWRTKAGLTKAKTARQLLDTYISLAAADSRTAVPVKKYTVHELGHDIAADVDLLLSGPRGLIGRICFTAAMGRLLTPDERALIAAAPLRGLCEEFEGGLLDDVIADIELWELRMDTTAVVTREEADAAWPALLHHLARATS
jgi:hypothetical protein